MTKSELPVVHKALHTSTANITAAAEETATIQVCEDDAKLLVEAAENTVPVQVCEDDAKFLVEAAGKTVPIQVCEDEAKLLVEAAEKTVPVQVCEDGAKLLVEAAEKTVPIQVCKDDDKLLVEAEEKTVPIKVYEDDAKLLIEAAEKTVPIQVCDDNSKISVDDSFEDKVTRLGFIQKVLVIKFMQLVGVVLIMTIFVIDYHNYGNIYLFVDYNRYLVFVTLSLLYIVTFGLLIYYAKVRTRSPYRYIFFVAYPLSYTLIICFALTLHEELEFFAAWYYYCLAVLALLVYGVFVYQTKMDFNIRFAILVSPLLLTIPFAVSYQLFPGAPRRVFYMVYPTIAVGIDLIFLLTNLEKMTSKNYRILITPADFVDAAINLHADYYYTFVNPIVICFKNVCNNLLE